MKKVAVLLLAASFLIGILAFAVSAGNTADNAGVYVVFGDSIAAGYAITDGNKDTKSINYVAGRDSNAYCGLVAREFGFDLINHSRSGATTTDLVNKLADPSVIATVKNAKLITVSIGGNDLIGMSTEVLVQAAIYEAVSSYYPNYPRTTSNIEEMYAKLESNLMSIMSNLVATNDGGVIMLQSLYNPFKYNKTYSVEYAGISYNVGDLIDYYINRINEIYYRVQKEIKGFLIVDTATKLNADGRSFYDINTPDFHPTDYGHRLIYEAITALYKDTQKPGQTTWETSIIDVTTTEETTTTVMTTTEMTTTATTAPTTTPAPTTASEITTVTETTTATEASTTVEATTVTETERTTVTESTTAAPADNGGCKSAIGISAVAVVIISGSIAFITKKEDRK